MKEAYETLEMEVIEFDNTDVITDSKCPDETEMGG